MTTSHLTPLPLKVIKGEAPLSSFPFGELNSVSAATPPESDRMQQLEQMIQQTQGRTEIIEKEAYDKAYQAGEKTGLEIGRKRAEQILSSMEKLLHLSEEALVEMHDHINTAMLEITEAVIHHVVGEMVKDHSAYLAQMVGKCAQSIPSFDTLKLAVAPENMSMFEKIMENTSDKAELIQDSHVRADTCRIMAKNNDTLIDPQAAITECMQHLRDTLLAEHIPSEGSNTLDPPS